MMSMRVLIADDETVQRMDLKDMLTAQGYQVVGEASDGASALMQARQFRPDVVILDIRMPEMDGLAAARAITQEEIAPVVLLSAFGDLPLVEQAKEAGVVSYLVKPLREAEVTPALDVAVARSQEMRTLKKEVDTLTERLATQTLVARAKGILMQKLGLSEAEAYRKIQKASMNSRKSMQGIAEAIILASDMEIDEE
jgi:AmiR/NasT family two-component response regulator